MNTPEVVILVAHAEDQADSVIASGCHQFNSGAPNAAVGDEQFVSTVGERGERTRATRVVVRLSALFVVQLAGQCNFLTTALQNSGGSAIIVTISTASHFIQVSSPPRS